LRGAQLQPDDLLKVAELLVKTSKKPSQAQLRRATSSIYYALFHTLCKTCADLLVGSSKAHRSRGAWRQAYRAPEHRFSKHACVYKKVMELFPNDIQDFADTFVKMQIKRHDADYDPYAILTKSEVRADIEVARQVIIAFNRTPKKDRRAFATHIILKQRE
jgi:uncharacterized protein (UPF0332 family)